MRFHLLSGEHDGTVWLVNLLLGILLVLGKAFEPAVTLRREDTSPAVEDGRLLLKGTIG